VRALLFPFAIDCDNLPISKADSGEHQCAEGSLDHDTGTPDTAVHPFVREKIKRVFRFSDASAHN
jgi:hypothetical protein